MSLYTSSSKLRLLMLSLLSTVVICVLVYHVLVVGKCVRPSDPMLVNSRYVQIQDFALRLPSSYRVTLTGSSWLKVVARSRVLPHGWYNLCIAGGSASDGCDAILTSGHYPETLIVEASERLRSYDDGNHPGLKSVSRWKLETMKLSPIFCEQYKPIAVLLSSFNLSLFNLPLPADQAMRRKEIIEKVQTSLPSKFALAELRDSANTLRTKLMQIREHGVRVLLLSTPKDIEIESTRSCQIINDTIKEALPESEFQWYVPEQRAWRTTDGGHLTKESARQFSIMLEDEIRKRGLD